MKTTGNKAIIFLTGTILLIAGESFHTPIIQQQPKAHWTAPAGADTLINPFAYSAATASVQGQKLYTQYCAACHGNGCKGDGITAASLTPRPANFMDPAVIKQSDGALFWKISNGKAPMPSWKATLNPLDRWSLVCFIRSVQAKAPAPKNANSKTKIAFSK